uniref:Uncharacterized protein n=1 Tax=Anopheles dirus TaxID=7168 RepID=A0A182N733_9DIPT
MDLRVVLLALAALTVATVTSVPVGETRLRINNLRWSYYDCILNNDVVVRIFNLRWRYNDCILNNDFILRIFNLRWRYYDCICTNNIIRRNNNLRWGHYERAFNADEYGLSSDIHRSGLDVVDYRSSSSIHNYDDCTGNDDERGRIRDGGLRSA